jgi:flagellar biosynthesis GTPase FlhF
MRSRIFSSVRIALSATLIALACDLPVGAQDPAQGGDTAKAIRELTGEVRSLRAAIEHTSETQLQGQILGLYLSLQQNRVSQAIARLDNVRRELEALGNGARELTQNAAAMEAALAQETDPAQRKAIEEQLRAQKQELERMTAQEQQVRAREAEADQSSQTEEARWTDLISRLEQLLKK